MTLKTIEQQVHPENWNVEIVIVDNDSGGYGKEIVDNFMSTTNKTVKYFIEPEKNISVARNRLIEMAEGELIVFIDDDECADPNWLRALYECSLKYNADVVFGKVIARYPDTTPEWIVKGRFFDRKYKETGTLCKSGGTGATLVKADWLKEKGYKFDLDYGLTGGEDSQLFYRMYKNNAKMVWCNEAFAEELIELKRLNKEYLIRRAIRVGETFVRYRFSSEDSRFYEKTFFLFYMGLKLIFYYSMYLSSFYKGEEDKFKNILSCCDAIGKIRSLIGIRKIDIYGD